LRANEKRVIKQMVKPVRNEARKSKFLKAIKEEFATDIFKTVEPDSYIKQRPQLKPRDDEYSDFAFKPTGL